MSGSQPMESLADMLDLATTPEDRAVIQGAVARALRIARPADGALFDVEPAHHARLLAAAARS